jgi:hypothetical protein
MPASAALQRQRVESRHRASDRAQLFDVEVTRFGKDGAAIGAAAALSESVFELPRLKP